MKLLLKTVLLLALHGAQASTRHKATKNAVDAETTQRLAVEAAAAGVVKMPGAVAKLFGREEGAEVPAKQADQARRRPQAPTHPHRTLRTHHTHLHARVGADLGSCRRNL